MGYTMISLPSPVYLKKKNFIFISYVDRFEKKMWEADKKARLKAVKYLKVKLRQLIKNKWGKGDLYKGVDYYNGRRISKIGFHKPAYHAHLLEFGTDERFVMNFKGHEALIKSVGRMEKQEFFKPFLNDEKNNVIEIINYQWLHNV